MKNKTLFFYKILIFLILQVLILLPLNSQVFDSKQLFSATADAVVIVRTPRGQGAGFFFNENGDIVTNLHIIATDETWEYAYEPSEIKIKTKTGAIYKVKDIHYINYNENLIDIVILRTNVATSNYLPITENFDVGDDIITIGHPGGDEWTLSEGVVSKIDALKDEPEYFQMSIPVDPGNSGGPLINRKGQCIGILAGAKFKDFSTVQETGKLGIKMLPLIIKLEELNIEYYKNPTLLFGLTDNEKQAVNLQKEKERLEKEKEKFQNERNIFWEEKNAFLSQKSEFEKQKASAQIIIAQANKIKYELDKENEFLEIKQRKIERKEEYLIQREQKISEQENILRQKIEPHFALDFTPGLNYVIEDADKIKDMQFHNISADLNVGLFFKFGYKRDYYGNPIANERIGFIYAIKKYYSIKEASFVDSYLQSYIFSLEFSSLIRLGFGVNDFQHNVNTYVFKDYTSFIQWNINKYPFPIALRFTTDFDKKFSNAQISLGFYGGFSLSFLRF